MLDHAVSNTLSSCRVLDFVVSTYLSSCRVLACSQYLLEFLQGVGSCTHYLLEFLQGVGSCDQYLLELLQGVGSCTHYLLEFLQDVGPCSQYLLEFLQGAHAVHVLVYPEGGSSEQEEEADVRESVRNKLGRRALHCLTDLQPQRKKIFYNCNMKEIIFFGSFYFEITPPVNPYPESALNEDVNKSFHAHRV